MSNASDRRGGSLRRKASSKPESDKPVKRRPRVYVEPDAATVVPGYGSTAQIRALADRLMVLEDVPEAMRAEALPAAMRAAQMCVLYGFMPGVQVHLYQEGEHWVADAGLRAWTESANRLAQRLRFTWLLDERELEDEEVRVACERSGIDYTPGDRAWECRVIRSDKLKLADQMGADYNPPFVIGFWNKKAREIVTDDQERFWTADPVYRGRDASYTARLRAQKAAMMVEFSLVADAHSRTDDATVARVMAQVESEIREREERTHRHAMDDVMFVRKDVNYEDDGDVLWK